MMMRATIILVCLSIVLGCGKKEAKQTAKEPPLIKPGTVLWEFETGGYVTSSPAVGPDGTVYVGSSDNKLYALNGKSGVKLWEFRSGSQMLSSPAITRRSSFR